jgi:hypothetical protein
MGLKIHKDPRRMKTTLAIVLALGTAAALPACGKKKHKATASAASGTPTTPQTEENVSMALTIEEAGVNLIGSTVVVNAAVNGCKSGRAAQPFDQTTTTLKEYTGDTGCVAKIGSIDVTFAGGDTAHYAVDAAYAFKAGDRVYATVSGKPSILITVASQLPDPIAAPASVAMTVAFVAADTSTTAATIAAVASTVRITTRGAIPYHVTDVQATVNAADGAGAFTATLNCLTAIAGSGATSTCDSMAQANFKGAIAAYDAALDDPDAGKRYDACRKIATGTGTAGATAYPAAGTALAPNGGIVLKGVGPATLCSNANLALAVIDGTLTDGSCIVAPITVSCAP